MRSGRDFLGVLIALAPLVIANWLFRNIEKFPTNDDWIYARSVHAVLEGPPARWAAVNGQVLPTAVTPVYLGALASKLGGGFSHGKLVAVTVIVSGVGVIGAYFLSRFAGSPIGVAILASWTLLFCPWVWRHVFTAMTDATAISLSAAATAAMFRGIQTDRWTPLWIGGILLAAAVWTRQPALALVVMPGASFYFSNGSRRDRLFRFAVCVVPSILAIASLEMGWFGPSGAERASFVALWPGFREWLPKLVYSAYGALLVVGFSMTPLAGLLAAGVRWNRGTVIAVLVGLLPAVFFAVRGGRAILTSATGPSLQNAHFGPILLGDCMEPGRWGDMGGVVWPDAIWFVATLLAFATLAIIVAASVDSFSTWWKSTHDRPHAAEVGLWLSGVGAGVVILFLMVFPFDRYWLAAAGPLIFWTIVRIARVEISNRNAVWGKMWAVASLAGFFAIDVVFTHDWLAFNETRWTLVRKLEQEGFSPPQIDGGYEVNGWHRSAEDPLTLPRPGGETALWWSEKAERFLAIGPRPGMIEVDRATWFSWAVRRPIPIVVLRRDAPAPARSSAGSPSGVSSPR